MPVTLAEYLRRSRSVLDEPATRFWTDAELTDWINDGARDLARKAEDLITYDTSIAVSPNVATYPLPSDVIRVHRIEFVPASSLQTYPVRASSQDEMDMIWGVNQTNPSSYPSYFVTRGYPGGAGTSAFLVQLYPVPGQPGTLNLYYYKTPRRLLSTEITLTIDLPEGWDDVVIQYVEWRALRKTKDPRWAEAKQLYDENIDYLINITRFYHDQEQVMTTASRTTQPTWLTSWPD
jgi:hypothetical protein